MADVSSSIPVCVSDPYFSFRITELFHAVWYECHATGGQKEVGSLNTYSSNYVAMSKLEKSAYNKFQCTLM
jgi:hypothetical protein